MSEDDKVVAQTLPLPAHMGWLEVRYPTDEKREPSDYRLRKMGQHTTRGGRGTVARLRRKKP